MEPDTSDKKPLENMCKEDIIKKYNKICLLAKKAQQSKHDALEELKNTKENEVKLTSEIRALKEIVESFTEKHKKFAEDENQIKLSEEKNSELKNALQKVEDKYALKIIECTKLQETLQKLSCKLSSLEEKYSENLEKFKKLDETYKYLDVTKEANQEKNLHKNNDSKDESKDLLKNLNEFEKENQNEKHISQVKEYEEKLMRIPKSWNDLISENEKLKEKLLDAENLVKVLKGNHSVSELHEAKEPEKILEQLLQAERKNLNLAEVGKFKASEKIYLELVEKNKHLEKILEDLRIKYDLDLKFLKEKLESEKKKWSIEKEDLELNFHKQKIDLENAMKLYKDKFDNQKVYENESLVKKLEENIDREKVFILEKEELLKEIENLKRKIAADEKIWEKHIQDEKTENASLKREREELQTIIYENKAFESAEVEKLNLVLENFKVEMTAKCPEWKDAIKKEDIKSPDLENTVESVKKKLVCKTINSEEMFKLKEKNFSKILEEGKIKWNNLEFNLNEKLQLALHCLEAAENNKVETKTDSKKLWPKNPEFKTLEKEVVVEEEGNADEKEILENTELLVKEKMLNINLIKEKSLEVLSSFEKIKVLRNRLDEEVKNKLIMFQLEQNSARQNLEEIVTKYVRQLHDGNSELLSEMNIMNQALKERGETISKLEELSENQRREIEEGHAKIATQCAKLQEKNQKLEEMEDEIGKVKMEVEIKHKAMRELEEEIWRIKNGDSQGETLSSSTLSKAEESSRLSELEESFEERYSKLKIVAVKLKKKVTELQKQVEVERSRLLATEEEYQIKVTAFHSQIKSLRNIQTEYDALLDVLDEERKEKSLLRKNLESAEQEMISLKREIEEIRSEKEKFKSDKSSFEKIKKELTAHIGELKQTIEKQKSECCQLEKEIQDLKNTICVNERHIEEEKEKHKAAILLLEEQKMESKKRSLLELEMAAYEKNAEDLKKKLDDKDQEVKNLENQLEREKEMRKEKEEETNRLKCTIADEQVKSNGLGGQVKKLSEELSNHRMEIRRKSEMIRSLEENVEKKNLRLENLSLELENITKDKYKAEEKYRSGEEKLFKQIHGMEEKISSTQDILSRKEIELEELKREYQAYKVRAQSVLRQSQKEINPSKQQNAMEELEQLKSTSESLKNRYEESLKKLKMLAEENETISEEKKRLFGRVQELNHLVTELREENQSLKEAKQRDGEDHAEALRLQKLQAETLAQCFQTRMKDLETNLVAEIENLKKEKEELLRQGRIYLKADAKRSDGGRDVIEGFVPVKPDKDMMEHHALLHEREECEGSESVDSSSPLAVDGSGLGLDLVPLEQLLNTSDRLEKTSDGKTFQELSQLRTKLEKSENRIKHLTVLLAEAESDSARLNQLNEVLKEEIRRHQRSLEREKHAQNFEYLKNVIVKFVSLQNVDEKLRLVPVLNTILKLSPDEENILTKCAKGHHDTTNRGWGTYLNIWAGGGGSGGSG